MGVGLPAAVRRRRCASWIREAARGLNLHMGSGRDQRRRNRRPHRRRHTINSTRRKLGECGPLGSPALAPQVLCAVRGTLALALRASAVPAGVRVHIVPVSLREPVAPSAALQGHLPRPQVLGLRGRTALDPEGRSDVNCEVQHPYHCPHGSPDRRRLAASDEGGGSGRCEYRVERSARTANARPNISRRTGFR